MLKEIFCTIIKMVETDSNFSPKVSPKFVCVWCDYKTCKSSDYKKHLSTDKHKKATNDSKQVVNDSVFSPKVSSKFQCECGKVYKYDSGYYRHIKKCNGTQISSNMITTELVMELIKDNKELKKIIIEQNSTINNLVQNGAVNNNSHNNINNNNNNNNKTFNLQFFLNETCKDAMNITDFVSNIKMELNDLENTGRIGYVDGISNIIVKNLNNMEQHMRPLHCSDLKREVLYIKDNNEWTKETDEKPILTKAIKTIANENIKQIKTWREKNPDCTDSGSKKNDLYLKIVSNSMSGGSKEECEKNYNKIINNVAKETVIHKDK